MTDEPAEVDNTEARAAIDRPGTADSTSVPPDPVEPADLGARLLDAAAEVFAERGYDKAGVAEIARRAGVTTGAIYARYPGKAELLVEAIDPHANDELERLFADHRFQGRMEDILLAAGSNLVHSDESDPRALSLLLESFVAARRHPEVAEVLRSRVLERRDRLTEIIEAAKADGGIDDELDTASVVLFCHAVGFGFLLVDALDLETPDAQRWQDLIARLVHALGATTSKDGSAQSNSGQSDRTTQQGEQPA